MGLQTTIRTPISAEGVGVHSGKKISLTFQPAPVNTGIIFRRSDLSPIVEIPALSKFVIDTRLSTCIGNNGHKVSTIEHVLAAISGLGIDNLYIEIDGEEVPIMDGSASPFVFLLKSAGIISQAGHLKKFIKIIKPISLDVADKTVTLKPFNGFKIKLEIDFNHPQIDTDTSSITIDFSSSSFIHEIARARTFGFTSDIELLRKQNLALGGSLKNSVVLDEKNILNPEGLRFKSELVRHKALDAIGDLYLFGMPLLGYFHGFKSGHLLNNLLIEKVLSEPESWEIVSFANIKDCPIKFISSAKE